MVIPRVFLSSCFSDHMKSVKKPEHSGQKRTISVGSVSSDPAVKDFSFFFDPNVQTGIISKGKIVSCMK